MLRVGAGDAAASVFDVLGVVATGRSAEEMRMSTRPGAVGFELTVPVTMTGDAGGDALAEAGDSSVAMGGDLVAESPLPTRGVKAGSRTASNRWHATSSE